MAWLHVVLPFISDGIVDILLDDEHLLEDILLDDAPLRQYL